MFYIKEKEQIVLFDENKQNIINTLDFQPQYKDLPILETKENEVIVDFKLMTFDEAEQQKAWEEKERIGHLHLTGADVERGLYKSRGIDFEDLIAMVQKQRPEMVKPLKIELKAKDFYRGNVYVAALGEMLGITPENLTKFFETNDYTYLLPPVEPTEPTEPTEEPTVPTENM